MNNTYSSQINDRIIASQTATTFFHYHLVMYASIELRVALTHNEGYLSENLKAGNSLYGFPAFFYNRIVTSTYNLLNRNCHLLFK